MMISDCIWVKCQGCWAPHLYHVNGTLSVRTISKGEVLFHNRQPDIVALTEIYNGVSRSEFINISTYSGCGGGVAIAIRNFLTLLTLVFFYSRHDIPAVKDLRKALATRKPKSWRTRRPDFLEACLWYHMDAPSLTGIRSPLMCPIKISNKNALTFVCGLFLHLFPVDHKADTFYKKKERLWWRLAIYDV